MPSEIALRFGDYYFPDTFYPAGVSGDNRIDVVEIPRRDGALVAPGRLKPRVIQIRGMLDGDTPEEMRSAVDAFRAAMVGRKKLYLWADRWTYAQKNGMAVEFDESSFSRYARVSVDFLADDPWWQYDAEDSHLFSGLYPGEGAISHYQAIEGTVTAWPIIEVTAATTGTLNIIVRNYPSSDLSVYTTFTLAGSVTAGDVLVVDCEAQTVVLKATGASKQGYFTGTFWSLPPNPNTMLYLNRTNVSSVLFRWRTRWL